MTRVDIIRNNLIDKILMISNEEYLLALKDLISASSDGDQYVNLTKEQALILEMSEDGIKNDWTISQDDL